MQEKKTEFIIQKRVHKLRSNAFYDIMKQELPDSIKLCFDLQQVLPLPKTPIQDRLVCTISAYTI